MKKWVAVGGIFGSYLLLSAIGQEVGAKEEVPGGLGLYTRFTPISSQQQRSSVPSRFGGAPSLSSQLMNVLETYKTALAPLTRSATPTKPLNSILLSGGHYPEHPTQPNQNKYLPLLPPPSTKEQSHNPHFRNSINSQPHPSAQLFKSQGFQLPNVNNVRPSSLRGPSYYYHQQPNRLEGFTRELTTPTASITKAKEVFQAGSSSSFQNIEAPLGHRHLERYVENPGIPDYSPYPQRDLPQYNPEAYYKVPFSSVAAGQPLVPLVNTVFVKVPPPPHLTSRPPQLLTSGVPQEEHHNIIFVKAPGGLEQPRTVVKLPPPPETKTKVYVLVKSKEDEDERISILAPKPTPPTKPQVFFIRYKTEQGHQEPPLHGGYL